MTVQARNTRLHGYMWIVAGLALPVAALTAWASGPALLDQLTGRHGPLIAGLMVILVLGELFPIPIARGEEAGDEITVSSTFALVLILVAPLLAAVLAQALALTLDEGVRRRRWDRLPFNIGQYTLSLVAARLAYDALSHRDVTSGLGIGDLLPLGPALCAAALLLVLNNGFVCIAVALKLQARIYKIFNRDLRFHVAVAVPLLGLAPVIAQSVSWTSWSLLLLLTPIVALHRSGHLAMRREQEALRDPLTQLGNRTLLQTAAHRTLAAASLSSAVLLIDLDHFKEINDTLGHAVGDEVLVEVARRLTASVRDEEDLVTRLGGDEFAILARGLTGTEGAEELAVRIIEALRAPVQVGEVRLDVQASIGIGLAPQHADTVAELLRVADVALYAAKANRGGYAFYRREDDGHSLARLGLQGDLRRALADPLDRQLSLAYQPQLDLRTGRVGSVECLARWQHPELGPLAPDLFIPIAENAGLVEPLTWRVLDLALDQLCRWERSGHVLRVAINLSARHLSDLTLPDAVGAALQRYGLSPDRLVLEVTESRLMIDPERAATVLKRLALAGVELSIDDFGTGYSSLAYLQRLDVDELKIDRTFIASLSTDHGNATIVRSTIDLGHSLGLRVVAEGVEDADAADMLRAWGCDLLQGFHIGRPTAAAELRDLGTVAWSAPPSLPGPLLPSSTLSSHEVIPAVRKVPA